MYEPFKERLGTRIRDWYKDNKEIVIAGAITALVSIPLVVYLGYNAIKSDNAVQKNIPKIERTTQKFNAPDNTKSLEELFKEENR